MPHARMKVYGGQNLIPCHEASSPFENSAPFCSCIFTSEFLRPCLSDNVSYIISLAISYLRSSASNSYFTRPSASNSDFCCRYGYYVSPVPSFFELPLLTFVSDASARRKGHVYTVQQGRPKQVCLDLELGYG